MESGIQIDAGVDDFSSAGMTTGAIQEEVAESTRNHEKACAFRGRQICEGFQRGAWQFFSADRAVTAGQPAGAAL